VNAREIAKINIHGHLRADQDLRARIALWEKWNIVRFCAACAGDHVAAASEGKTTCTNDLFLAAKREFGEILVGFAGVDLTCERISTPDEIDRRREQGFVGLKFIYNSYPYSDERFYPLYERAEALGMPILFHTGCLAPHSPAFDRRFRIAADNMRAYHLDPVARCFPRLVLIAAHLGLPHAEETTRLLTHYPSVYADITGGGGKPPHVRTVASRLLPHPALDTDMQNPEENRSLAWFEKICWGTDNPEPDRWVPAAEWVLDRLQIPAPLRERFYYGTDAKILGIHR